MTVYSYTSNKPQWVERQEGPRTSVFEVVSFGCGWTGWRFKAREDCMSRQPAPVEDGTHDMNAKAPAIVVSSASTTQAELEVPATQVVLRLINTLETSWEGLPPHMVF